MLAPATHVDQASLDWSRAQCQTACSEDECDRALLGFGARAGAHLEFRVCDRARSCGRAPPMTARDRGAGHNVSQHHDPFRY
jgi:hypothetical protein